MLLQTILDSQAQMLVGIELITVGIIFAPFAILALICLGIFGVELWKSTSGPGEFIEIILKGILIIVAYILRIILFILMIILFFAAVLYFGHPADFEGERVMQNHMPNIIMIKQTNHIKA